MPGVHLGSLQDETTRDVASPRVCATPIKSRGDGCFEDVGIHWVDTEDDVESGAAAEALVARQALVAKGLLEDIDIQEALLHHVRYLDFTVEVPWVPLTKLQVRLRGVSDRHDDARELPHEDAGVATTGVVDPNADVKALYGVGAANVQDVGINASSHVRTPSSWGYPEVL